MSVIRNSLVAAAQYLDLALLSGDEDGTRNALLAARDHVRDALRVDSWEDRLRALAGLPPYVAEAATDCPTDAGGESA